MVPLILALLLISYASATQISSLPCLADSTTFHINSALGTSRDLGLTVTIGLSRNTYTPGSRAIPIVVAATLPFNEFIMYAQRNDMMKVGSFSNLTQGMDYNTAADCNNTTPQSTIWSTTDTTPLGPGISGLMWTPPAQPGSGTIQFYACIAIVGNITTNSTMNSTTGTTAAATTASTSASFDCWASTGYNEAGAASPQPPTDSPITLGTPTITIIKGPGSEAVPTGLEAIGGGVGRSAGWAMGVAVGMLGFLLALV